MSNFTFLEARWSDLARLGDLSEIKAREKLIESVVLGEMNYKEIEEILTEFYVFLVKLFQKKGEEAYVQKLLKSAKARRMVNTQVVWDNRKADKITV